MSWWVDVTLSMAVTVLLSIGYGCNSWGGFSVTLFGEGRCMIFYSFAVGGLVQISYYYCTVESRSMPLHEQREGWPQTAWGTWYPGIWLLLLEGWSGMSWEGYCCGMGTACRPCYTCCRRHSKGTFWTDPKGAQLKVLWWHTGMPVRLLTSVAHSQDSGLILRLGALFYLNACCIQGRGYFLMDCLTARKVHPTVCTYNQTCYRYGRRGHCGKCCRSKSRSP